MYEFRTNHCKEVNSLMLVSFTDIGWQAQQGPPTVALSSGNFMAVLYQRCVVRIT